MGNFTKSVLLGSVRSSSSKDLARKRETAKWRNIGKPLVAVLLFLICCAGNSKVFSQTTTLAGVTVPATNIGALVNYSTPSAGAPIDNFSLSQSGSNDNLTQVQFTTTGSYTTSDIASFVLYVNTISNSFNGSVAVPTGSMTAGAAGLQTLTLSTVYPLIAGSNYYFFIVPVVNTGAVAGNTIAVNAIASGDVTVSTGTVSGSTSATGTVTIISPAITGTTPSSRCGTGTVTLNATPAAGGSVNWYTTATGGTSLFTGNAYTTPSISSNTPYYAEAFQGATIQAGTLTDLSTNTATYNMNQRTDLHYFSTTAPCTINSVDVYPSAAGTLYIVMCNNYGSTTGTPLATAGPITITSGQVSNTVPVTIPLNFSVPAGATNYQLGGSTSGTAQIYRGASNSTYGPYPTTVNGFALTGDAGGNSTATGTSGAYTGYGARCYFYNWNVTVNTSTGTRTAVVATVNPVPTSVNATASPTPICVGNNLTLTGAAIGATSYAWSGPGGTGITNASLINANVSGVVPANAGVYTLTATVGPCSTVATTSPIVVNSATLTPTFTSSPGAITCSGVNVTYTTQPGQLNYVWSVPGIAGTDYVITGGGVGSASNTVTLQWLTAGSKTVTVNFTTGCSGLTPASSTTAVSITPNLAGIAIPSAGIPCIGSATNVTVNAASLVDGTYTVTYNLSGANTATGNTATMVFAAGTGTFTTSSLTSAGSTTLTITSIATLTGCTTGSSVANTFNVNVLPASIGGTGTVCPASTLTLTDATAGGRWSSSNTALATIGSASGILTGVAGGNPTITYTAPTGCITTAPVTVNTIAPITGTFSLCTGLGTTLTNSISGGTWTSSNTAVATIGSSTGVVTSLTTGLTTIVYTFPNGCTTSQTLGVVSTIGTFSVTGGGSFCAGGTGVNVGLSGSDAGVSYQLLVSGSPTGSPILGTGSAISFGPQTVGGSYTVVANIGSPCAVTMSSFALVTVLPVPTVFNVSGGGGYCTGGSGVNVGLDGSASGINYQLFKVGTGSVSSFSGTGTLFNFGSITAVGTYTVVATNPISGCTSNMSSSATVTINPLPAVFSMTGTGGYCIGSAGVNVGLSSSIVGINYQLFNGVTPVGGAVAGTGASISFGAQTVGGTYTAVATNTVTGCTSNMSGTAVVSANPLPTPFSVTGGGNFCLGGTGVPVGLGGSSLGVSYQLYVSGSPYGAPVTGTGVAIAFAPVTNPGVYTVLATNSSTGCTNTMVGSATVVVNPLPTAFNVTGGGSYCSGTGGLRVGLSGSVVGTNYYLYNGATLLTAASGTSAALDFGLEVAAGTYTVSATLPGTGCTAVMTGSVNITVTALPNVYNVTGGGNICAGATGVNVGLSSSTLGVNYVLTNGGTPIGAPLAGTGSALAFGTFTTPGTYRVTAISTTTGCVNTMAGSAVIVVNPLPGAYTVTGGGNYCTGGTGVSIGLANSDAGISYRLYNGVTAVGTPVSGTGTAITFGLITASGVYTVRATNTVTGCVNTMSGSTSVGINALPAVYFVTGGGTYCAGGSGYAILLSNSASGVNYQLFRGTTPVGGAVAGTTGSGLNFGLQTTAGSYTVVATDAVTGCTNSMSGVIAISVNPLPAVFNVTGGGNYCTGGSGVNVGLSGSVVGINYQLYNGIAPVGTPVAGSSFALSFGLQTAAGTYTVKAINPSTGCSSVMDGSAVININALPATYAVTGGGNFCAGGSGVQIGLTSSDPGVNYQLYIGASPIGTVMAGTGGTLDFGYQIIGGVYTVKATNALTGCLRTMTGSATVVVNPLPTVQILTGGGDYCIGGLGVHIGLSGSQAGISYQLSNGLVLAGSPITGVGTSIDFGYQTAVGSYTATASNPATGCSSNMWGTKTINISTQPTVYSVTGTGNYCPSGSGVVVGLDGSDIGTNYQLYGGITPIGSLVPGTGSSIDFGYHGTGTYTVVAIGSGTSCIGNMFGNAVIGISPLPVVHNVTGGGGYCVGGAGVTVALDNTDIGTGYQLYNGSAPVGFGLPGTGAALSFGVQTVAGAYRVVATGLTTGCTSNMADTVSVVVNPLPIQFTLTGGGHYCSGGIGQHVLISSTQFGCNYQLYNNGNPVGTTQPGFGYGIDFGLQTAAGVYTIRATNPITGCANWMSNSVTITIDPLPGAFNVTGGGHFCGGGSGVHVMLSGSDFGISYQLYNGLSTVGSSFAGNGFALDFGSQTAPGNYTVVATNNTAGCTINMSGSANVIVDPLPAAYILTGSSAGYCIGGAGVIPTLSGSGAGVSYQLFRGTAPVGFPQMGTSIAMSFPAQTVAGSYSVVGTNATTGCVNNMGGAMSVVIYSLPTAHNVTGGGSYCSGGTGVNVGLDGSDTTCSYQLIFSGLPYGPSVNGNGSILNLGALTVAGNYTVMATNRITGCTSMMTGVANVVVNSLPVSFVTTGGGSYCAGGSGVAIGLSNSTMGVSYQLLIDGSPTGTPVAGTGGPISFGNQTSAGTYTVMATNTTTGCSKLMTGSSVVAINPAPAVFTVLGGGSFCAGGPGVHINLSGSNTGVTYKLYRGGSVLVGSPMAGTGLAIDYGLITVPGVYTVIAVDNITGCTSTMAGSVVITVNANPVVYTVTGGGNYCAGGAGVHIGLSGSQSGVNYTLSVGASPVVTIPGTGGAIDFGLQTAIATYSVSATNASTGCTTAMTGTAAVASTPVVVPAVTISTGVGDTVCAGIFTTFTGVTVNGGTAPSYQWSINGVPVASLGNSYSYVPVDGDHVTVQLTSNATCATPAVATNSMNVHVNTSQMPYVAVAVNPGTTICQGTTVNFTAVPGNGGTAPSYTWKKNGNPVGSTGNTYSTVPANGDVFTCILHSNYRCRMLDTAISAPATMTVASPVTPTVSINSNPGLRVPGGTTITMDAVATNAGSNPTYQWKINGNDVPGAVSPQYMNNTYNEGDLVTCNVWSSGTCAGTLGSASVTVHVIPVGVQNVTALTSDIKLLPNPNNGNFTLKGTISTTDEMISVDVTNMLGQTVYTGSAKVDNGTINSSIQLNNVSNGMYILNLRSTTGNQVFHLVIEQ